MDNNELYNAVWRRRSVRKYNEKKIEPEKIEALKSAISSLNEESGLTIEFFENSEAFNSFKTVGFKGVRSVIAVKGKTSDPDLFEKCGYYGEKLLLKATALGLGTCWVAMGFSRNGLNIKADEEIACAVPIGYGAEEIVYPQGIPDAPHRKTISISEFLDGKTDVPDWVKTAVKSVQFAPTARNSQKTRFRFTDGQVTADIPSSKVGIFDKLNMIDLGITKLHFELAAGGKFSYGSPGRFEKY
ncbi:MAG: nitroreductase family protein [Methanomassiliicoccaceae archaeon]|nr:nitroreductase family protein [Methanomassiliicoccaceae archaeon]